MAEPGNRKPHFILSKNGQSKEYTYPRDVVFSAPDIPEKARDEQYAFLKSRLEQVAEKHKTLAQEAVSIGLDEELAIQISVDSVSGVEMPYESLADARQNIELLNVKKDESQTIANVLVPAGKLESLHKKLEDYLNRKVNKNGDPLDNRKLIDSINSIGEVRLEMLWSDSSDLFPTENDGVVWWEVWLPVAGDRESSIDRFNKIASETNIEVSPHILEFPERSVLLVKSDLATFSSSALLLSQVAELKRAKKTAEFFDESEYPDQANHIEDLLQRSVIDDSLNTYVCVLDTGINNGHPLLAPFLGSEDQFSVDPEWGLADDNGHGTGMAGLTMWGDLTDVLATGSTPAISHKLESVKLLRHSGDNDGEHLGNITAEGISLPENANHERNRIFAMAVSAKDSMDRGKASSWSAAIDSQTSDYLGDNSHRRLIIISAGNTGDDLDGLKEYPQYNELQDIQDPGQAWNALTVGGYTNKVTISEEDASSYRPLAPGGGLSPYSTTSVLWDKAMPIKPEIVFEAGNIGIDDIGPAGLSSLKLLTTDSEIRERYLTTFNATSAATALASNFAAKLVSQYPDLWPETIRALMVHSANWTDAMKAQSQYAGSTDLRRAKHLARTVGYGVPDIEKALWSLNNSLALIVEDELQPYEKVRGRSPTSKDMHLQSLPWPITELEGLGDAEVKMTVTLSYYIEPNPSSRNISSRYRYPSHLLRFDVKRPTESMQEFLERCSRDSQDEDYETGGAPSDTNWLLGDFRNRGSIHKDVWTGTAADLAQRSHIIVYPAMGWWRTRTKLGHFNKSARYSLIVSIEAPETEVDLYTEVENAIVVENLTSVEIPI